MILLHDESRATWNLLIQTLKQINFKFRSFIYPLFLGLLGSIFEALSLILIIPTLQLIINGKENKISEIINFTDKHNSIMAMMVAVIGLAALRHIVFYKSNIEVFKLSNFANKNIRSLLLKKYLSFGKLYFDTRKQAQIIQILKSYSQIPGNILSKINTHCLDLLLLLIHILIMVYISFSITVIICLTIPCINLIFKKSTKKITAISKERVQIDSQIAKHITEIFTNLPLVKAYNTHGLELQKLQSFSVLEEKIALNIKEKMALIAPMREIIGLVILFSVIFFLYKFNNHLDIASSGVFILLLRRISGKLGVINEINTYLASNNGELQKINEVIIELGSEKIISGSNKFMGLEKELKFQNVYFNYNDKQALFDKLKFSIKKGQTTAIVGESGAGKSTIINLLMRFYQPLSGQILADKTSISEYSLESWLENIALVSQEALIFSDTIKENLVYGLPKINLDELDSAIKFSKLSDFIEKSPEKLETIVGDRGVKLSQGEKQRISIARAFLKKAEILIFDEPTSSLDAETESELKSSLDILFKNKTVIIVAHRLSTIKNVDNVIFLKDGKIIESGTPEDLISNSNTYFSKYWKLQGLRED